MDKTVLQFSGGKDSLACLYLSREHWQDPDWYLMWCNTGAAYGETVALMDVWRSRVRNFIEVRTNQPQNTKQFGMPSDVVPMKYTYAARQLGFKTPFLLQAGYACCNSNIWLPMALEARERDFRVIIRGQRDSEPRKAPITDGQVIDGVTYRLPLQSWSADKVFAYLHEQGAEIPSYYAIEGTSRDCWNCTAYLDDGPERIRRLPGVLKRQVLNALCNIDRAVSSESSHYLNVISEELTEAMQCHFNQ